MKTKAKMKRLTARVDAIEDTLARHLVKDHDYEENEDGRIVVEEPMAPVVGAITAKDGE